MQSLTRKQKRINNGLQNPAPSSTKISSSTPGVKMGSFECFRTGRFNWRNPIYVNRSGKRWIVGWRITTNGKEQYANADANGMPIMDAPKKTAVGRLLDKLGLGK